MQAIQIICSSMVMVINFIGFDLREVMECSLRAKITFSNLEALESSSDKTRKTIRLLDNFLFASNTFSVTYNNIFLI